MEGLTVNHYRLGKKLGSGAFGVAYLSTDLHNNQTLVVKVIDIQAAMNNGIKYEDLQKEVKAQATLSHEPDCNPFVVCYSDSFETTLGNPPKKYFFVVSEYIDGGMLEDYINKYAKLNQWVPVESVWKIMNQLVFGLKYMHDKGYAHRDIKPGNIMLTASGDAKYIDLGLACFDSCQPGSGTMTFMPPEVLNRTAGPGIRAAKAHDVWSLGMVLFELCTLYSPFHDAQVPQGDYWTILEGFNVALSKITIDCVYAGSADMFLNIVIGSLVNWMLTRDMNTRPTADQLSQYIQAENAGCVMKDGYIMYRDEIIRTMDSHGIPQDPNDEIVIMTSLCAKYKSLFEP